MSASHRVTEHALIVDACGSGLYKRSDGSCAWVDREHPEDRWIRQICDEADARTAALEAQEAIEREREAERDLWAAEDDEWPWRRREKPRGLMYGVADFPRGGGDAMNERSIESLARAVVAREGRTNYEGRTRGADEILGGFVLAALPLIRAAMEECRTCPNNYDDPCKEPLCVACREFEKRMDGRAEQA